MNISKHSVVSLHYTLKNSDGTLLDTSENREPLVYLHGVGALIPGMEEAMEGKTIGDKFSTVIPPEKAYGSKRDDLLKQVPKSGFQGDEELVNGMQVELNTEHGRAIATVVNIEGEEVTLDLNHPLADMTLHFDVEITEVRAASEDEIAHGHVHGPGGHHH